MGDRDRLRLAPGARDALLAVYVRGSAATALAARRWSATRQRLHHLADGTTPAGRAAR